MKRIEDIPSASDSAAPYHVGEGRANVGGVRPRRRDADGAARRGIHWQVLFGLVVVLVANGLYLHGLDEVLDPMMSMDPFYITMSRQPLSRIFAQEASWGPLYAVWLRPLSLWLEDPLVVYRANVRALSLLVSVDLYLFLWLRTRRPGVAVAAAVVFVLSDVNVPLFSKVSEFAVGVVLLGLILGECVSRGSRRLAVGGAAIALAAYARPELYPAALLVLLVSAWGIGQTGRRRFAVALLVLGFAVGLPGAVAGEANARLLLAFREHFAWNWTRWHDRPQSVDAAWREAFGAATSVSAAAAANPAAFVRHVGDNLIGATRFSAGWSMNHWPIIAPHTMPGTVDVENAVFQLLAWVALGVAGWRRALARHRDLAVVTAALLFSGMVSAGVVYPSPHYLMPTACLFVMWSALALTELWPARRATDGRVWALSALVALALVPRPFEARAARVIPGSPLRIDAAGRRPITATVLFVRGLNLPKPTTVMTVGDGIGDLLGNGFREVRAWQRGSRSLVEYLRENDVAVIISRERGRRSFVLEDPYWEDLHLRPRDTPYERIDVPGASELTVFVRRAAPGG